MPRIRGKINAESLSDVEESVTQDLSRASTPRPPGRPRKRKRSSAESPSHAARPEDVGGVPASGTRTTSQEDEWSFLQDIKNARSEVKPPSEEAQDGDRGEPSELLSHSQMTRMGDARTWYDGKWYIGAKDATKAQKLQNIRDAFKMPARTLLDPQLHPKDPGSGSNLPEDRWTRRFLGLFVQFAALCTSERQLNRLLSSEIYQRDMGEVADSESDTEPRVGLRSWELKNALDRLRAKQTGRV